MIGFNRATVLSFAAAALLASACGTSGVSRTDTGVTGQGEAKMADGISPKTHMSPEQLCTMGGGKWTLFKDSCQNLCVVKPVADCQPVQKYGCQCPTNMCWLDTVCSRIVKIKP